MSESNNTAMDNIARRRYENTQFGFLSLPAEIRNQIYGYVAIDHYAKLTRKLEDENKAEASDQDIMKYRRRQSLGLTQVCAQIHQEFLPLHLSSLHCSIDDMVSYMSTFYSSGRGLCGSINLNLTDLPRGVCDFLPLLRLKSSDSNVNLGINHKDKRCLEISQDMRHVLFSGANKTWSDFLFNKVSKFEYCMGKEDAIRIVMKPSAKEEWMPWDPKTDGKKEVSETTRRAMARWRIFNGLVHLKEMPLVVVEDE